MARGSKRNRRRTGKLAFEMLEPRIVLDAQLGALFDGLVTTPAAGDVGGTPASEIAGAESQLVQFGSADELKQYLIRDAEGRYADLFGRDAWRWWNSEYDGPVLANVREGVAVAGNAADFSTTNTQVAGVDEGDLIKTDGRYLYVGQGSEVTIVDAQSAADMRVVAQLDDAGPAAALYLSDDRLTVISMPFSGFPEPMLLADVAMPYRPWAGGESKFQVTVYDVSAPEAPQVIRRLEIEGNYVDSRMIGETVYLVSSHQFHLPPPEIVPGGPVAEKKDSREGLRLAAEGAVSILPWPGPNPDGSGWVYETREQYWARIGDSVLDLALSNYTLLDASGETVETGLLSAAEAVYRPLGGQDDQLVTITAFDVGAEQPAVTASSSAPIGWTSTVYVSPQSLYLVTMTWNETGPSSELFKFDLRPVEGQIPLVATGKVAGRVLNSFSLDELGSHLRIVTQSGWRAEAESALYVLDQVGEKLVTVGQIEDLAPGEELYSVRFLGDRAFVVTFGPDGGNWIDPLFTIDLSDPAAPRVEGELEIPGFSNYLQMIDGHYLLGLGRNADESTGRQLEPQVSLFDTSDFADPQLADRVSFGDASSWSEAFFNHHAVSYFPEQHVLAVPLDTWFPQAAPVLWELGDPSNKVTDRMIRLDDSLVVAVDGEIPLPAWQSQLWVFRIDPTGEKEQVRVLGTIGHDSSILRSLRIGEQLFSISADTIQAHNIFDPGEKLGELYFGPRALDDWFSVDRNSRDNVLDVLSNDRIGDAGGWKVTAVGEPEHGVVTISDDGLSLLYTPADGFVGADSFAYTITGPNGSTAEAQATVDVNDWADQQRMAELARLDLAQQLEVPAEEIEVVWTENAEWPDSCLGVAAPDQNCLTVITPGFRVALRHADTTYTYHTDTVATVILAETAEDPVRLDLSQSEPLVRVRLEVTDASGQAITSIKSGETFTVNAYVDDLSAGGKGVFAAYGDILYPARLVGVAGDEIAYGEAYANGLSGDAAQRGLVDELGAFSGFDTLGAGPQLLASVPFVAKRAGLASFLLTLGDKVGHEVLIYGSDVAIPPSLVEWQGAELQVIGGWRNIEDPTDVNDDGDTTPQDALHCINVINARGRQHIERVELPDVGEAADLFFLDVNGDDSLTPSDVLTIVNCLNTGEDDTASGTSEAALPARPLASWVDWKALNDILHQENWQQPLDALQLTPERMLDLVHGFLATVDADRLDELLQDSPAADPAKWREAIAPVLDAIREHASLDQLLDLADQLQSNLDGLDLKTVMPNLGRQINIDSANQVFHDKFFAQLSNPLLLLDLLDG